MGLSIQKFREIVFQLLYSLDFEQGSDKGVVSLVMRQNKMTKSQVAKCYEMSKKIWQRKDQLNQKIQKFSSEYDLERIPKAERNILRLAIYEVLFSDVPYKVAIVEAMRLSRKYVTPETASFINAVLDGIYQDAVSTGQVS